jgi:hypothetical protein
MYLRPTLAITLAFMLSACAASGPPENVSKSFDGKYLGVATPKSGPCTSNPNYDVTMNIREGVISGSATNGEYDFELDGYVTDGGNISGEFLPTGPSSRSVGHIDGSVTSAGKIKGDWKVGLGAGCSGSMSLASKS